MTYPTRPPKPGIPAKPASPAAHSPVHTQAAPPHAQQSYPQNLHIHQQPAPTIHHVHEQNYTVGHPVDMAAGMAQPMMQPLAAAVPQPVLQMQPPQHLPGTPCCSRLYTLSLHWYNVGPASQTMDQHYTSSMCCVVWHYYYYSYEFEYCVVFDVKKTKQNWQLSSAARIVFGKVIENNVT